MAFVVADDKVEDFLKEKADKDKVKQIYKAVERFEKHHKVKPQTNNNRINTMSAEEKAEWLFEHDRITVEKGRLSKSELLQWLKSEAKEVK